MLFGSKDLSARKCRFNWWLEILSEGDQPIRKQIDYQNKCWQRSIEHRSILVPFLWLFMISCVESLLLQQFCCPLLGGNWRFVGVWWAFTWFHFFTLCCILRETLAHHNNSFPYRFSKDQLKTVERQLSDAGRTQDPAFKGIPQHGCIVGQCSIIFSMQNGMMQQQFLGHV